MQVNNFKFALYLVELTALEGVVMTKVQFPDIKPFVSCCKDLEIVFHIPSSIKASNKHYIALCELLESSQFTWVWAGKTAPLEQDGTVKWRKGKVTFASHVLPKLSNSRKYYVIYCNEDGTILGESQPFQFSTAESDEFSLIDLQSTPSDDVIMISMHGKKTLPTPLPTSSSEIIMHNDDTVSFEAVSEQTYSDTNKEKAEETEYFSQTCTAVIKNNSYTKRHFEKSDPQDQKEPRHKRQRRDSTSSTNVHSKQENTQEIVALKEDQINRLKDELIKKDNIIEELQTENITLKEQIASCTCVLSSSALQKLVDLKEAKLLENEKTKLIDESQPESRKIQQQLQILSQGFNTLQTENKKLAQRFQNLVKSTTSNLDLGNF